MPPPDLQLSVFLVTSLPSMDVWELGKGVPNKHPRPSLYGKADITVGTVQDQNLKASRDDDPPRHVNIVGWPDYADAKDRIKSIAQELARYASLTLLPKAISK